MNFQELELHPKILQAITKLNYVNPTPIQQEAIPQILANRDILGSAQTGTGKTAAFLLPMFNQILQHSRKSDTQQKDAHPRSRGPSVLILVPTRELAMQVAQEAQKFGQFVPFVKTVCVYGGTPYPIQNKQLAKPYDILVATPGRLMDHMQRGRIQLGNVQTLILDEADRMLDMGFISAVEEIASKLPDNTQTLLFSATLKGEILRLAKKLLKDPVTIAVQQAEEKHDHIAQTLYHVDDIEHKYRLLHHLLSSEAMNQAIIFTSTKSQASVLAERLQDLGFYAGTLHGDMNQRQRSRTLERLRLGQLKILVATDVAARGIDVQTISHVFNFDLPSNAEDYVHRIGRTGRAGKTGAAHTFAAVRDMPLVRRIEQYTEKRLQIQIVPGFEAKMKAHSQGPKSVFRSKRRFGSRR